MAARRMKEMIYKRPFLYAMMNVMRHCRDDAYLNRINHMIPAFCITKGTMELSRGKTYYIIEKDWGICGFFAIMQLCLLDFCVADAMGFIPYVNITNSIYNVKGGWLGTDNMFEYYFVQPITDSPERIKKEENYFLSSASCQEGITKAFSESLSYEYDDRQLRYMGGITGKYIHLRPELEQELTAEIAGLLGEKRTLGIHYRGTDFKLGFRNHPVALKVEQYFPHVEEALQNGFTQIFLATDDTTAVEAFRAKFGGIVLAYHDVMRTSGTTGVHLLKHEKEEDKYYRGREVLRDMLTLSRCSGLIAGNSNISESARIWKYAQNAEFEYLRILSNGQYRNYSREAKQYINEHSSQMKGDL